MEGKQLKINQPIPSVRRFKKDQKSKLVNYTSNKPPLRSHKSELNSGPITNPGTIPFIWEQSPGRPKVDPLLPQRKLLTAKTKSCNNNLAKLEEESDLDDGHEADLDTADSISQTASLSLNCSSSGVSGIDGQGLKRSTDQLTRDHMMGRFLPAAKAMAEETPQYSQWKHNDNKYPIQGGAHMVLENDNKIQDQGGAHGVPDFPVETEEQENYEYVKCRKSPLKVCQILPGLCFLNPILPRKLQVPIPRAHIVKRSIFPKRKKYLGIHGEGNNDDLGGKTVERTLYVDTIHKLELQKQNHFSRQSKVKSSLRKNDIKILARNGRIKDTHLVDSCKDSSSLLMEEEEVIVKQLKDTRIQELGGNEDFLQDLIDLKNRREDRFISFELPVPPPLPKSPTDSWLCRTLPPTSSKKNDETINIQNSDLQFSKEPLMPIPETE